MTKPTFCTKPRPCDWDADAAYCPHRECRQAAQKHMSILQRKLEVQEDYATSRLCVAHRGHWSRDRCVLCENEKLESQLDGLRHDLERSMARENEQLNRLDHFRSGIRQFLEGDYEHPKTFRATTGECPHGKYYYECCESCDETFLQSLLDSEPGTAVEDQWKDRSLDGPVCPDCSPMQRNHKPNCRYHQDNDPAVKARVEYVCPQCGPDPRGETIHTREMHTLAGLFGETDVEKQDQCRVYDAERGHCLETGKHEECRFATDSERRVTDGD